jgi:hypothetical protein
MLIREVEPNIYSLRHAIELISMQGAADSGHYLLHFADTTL